VCVSEYTDAKYFSISLCSAPLLHSHITARKAQHVQILSRTHMQTHTRVNTRVMRTVSLFRGFCAGTMPFSCVVLSLSLLFSPSLYIVLSLYVTFVSSVVGCLCVTGCCCVLSVSCVCICLCLCVCVYACLWLSCVLKADAGKKIGASRTKSELFVSPMLSSYMLTLTHTHARCSSSLHF